MYQLHPLDCDALHSVTCPDYLLLVLFQCTLCGATLEEYLKAMNGSNTVAWAVMKAPRLAHVTPLIHKYTDTLAANLFLGEIKE